MGLLIFVLVLLILLYCSFYKGVELNNTYYISNDSGVCKVIDKNLFRVTISTMTSCYDVSLLEFILYFRKYND